MNDSTYKQLAQAIRNGRIEALRQLLADGADPNYTDYNHPPLLSLAAEAGCLEAARTLLDHGANPNPMLAAFLHLPPLHHATIRGDLDLMRLLLLSGADPDATCRNGTTAFGWAVRKAQEKAALLLLEHGAKAEFGQINPVLWVMLSGTCSLAWTLYERGVLPDGEPKVLEAALRQMARQGQTPLLEVLLSMGVDPNAQDDRGNTALHLAAMYGREELVSYLLGQGADPQKANAQGETPLDLARLYGKEAAARLLEQIGETLTDPVAKT